jgi:hypothetical protein
MPEPRAQRTLVKSPPELWAEVSDLEALARHLGEFGEIRITRLEPETTVAWEGDRARGTVELEPAGWGTKVTLTAELAEVVAPLAAEPGQGSEEETAEAVAEPEPEAIAEPPAPDPEPEPEPEAIAEPPAPEPEPEPDAIAEPPAPEAEPASEPRVGFFARLFGRRKAQPAAEEEREPIAEEQLAEPEPVAEPIAIAEPEPEAVAEPEPVSAEPEPLAAAEPEPVAAEPDPEPAAPDSLDAERAAAILTGVLDDLGSAHHRPFSRG